MTDRADTLPRRLVPRRLGLQGRVLVVITLFLLIVGALVGLMLARQAVMQSEVRLMGEEVISRFHEQTMRERGLRMATDLAGSLAQPMVRENWALVDSMLEAVSAQQLVKYVRVVDVQGRIQFDGTAPAGQAVAFPDDTPVMELELPILSGQRRVGGLEMAIGLGEVGAQRDVAGVQLQQVLGESGRSHLYVGIALLMLLGLLTILVAVYVQRVLVRPIRILVSAAKRIESGDYGVELRSLRAGGEVGDLVRVFRGMSQAIASHDKAVTRLAYTDALTGLDNRLHFHQQLTAKAGEALDEALRQRSNVAPMALLFVDVDDFKRVNDTLGHEAGDEVLLRFVERIRSAVALEGGKDALLARFGGDEFVILLSESDVRVRAARLAALLVRELARPLLLNGREVFLGSSIGITQFPDDASDASGLIKNGDIAMYLAKSSGKNCYQHYSRDVDRKVEHEVRLEQELRGAWERGELQLVYQPIYRIRDKRLIGAESLLRWNHPSRGPIPPSIFIPVAERSGLIEQIGPRVLQVACQEAGRWGRMQGGEGMFVSVNVSARQLRATNLAETVIACLDESGLPAARLHIELTETAVIGDEVLAATLLDKLHRRGVKVWLDDFGTGFSGLSHLRQVPVDGVKIDKSFVADMQNSPDDLALTTAVIAMCHALGITVVAEGIEHEAQYSLLAQRGCDLAQGYWLARPMTSAQIIDLLQSPVAMY